MTPIGNADHSTLSGWSAVGALIAFIVTKALTAFVMSFPIVASQPRLWLRRRHPGDLRHGPLELLALRGLVRDLVRGADQDRILWSRTDQN